MAVRTYITETEFAKIDNPQSATTYIVLDDNDLTLVKKVVFKTNNINSEGEVYIVQDEFPTPSGAIDITANANNIDVKRYATANVNVPQPTGTITIDANATGIDIAQYATADVNVPNPSTGTLVITSNDTYDVTNYASAEVNVAAPAPVQKTCSFKFNSDGQFQFIKRGIGSYYLKVNDGEWTEYTDSQTVSVVTGDVIEFRSDVKQYLQNTSVAFNDYPAGAPAAVSWELEGDLIGALYGDTFPIFGCYGVFKNCTGLTKVPNDMFANFEYTPSSGCQEMFYGCTSLTTAPALPATTIGSYSYNSMFEGCTSLTTAPALPATTVASYSYGEMFKDCTSLTTAPTISATSLDSYSCSSMFEGCTSLTTVPTFLATALDQYSCNKMFYGCTSLTTVPTLPATSLVGNCYNSMFYGCTSLTTAPTISATSLASYSCSSMFEGCTSLTTAPTLLATTLTSNCYRNMFRSCTSLNYVKCLATSGISTTNLSSWLSGVSATGTFVKAASASYSTGASGIPSGWTVEDAA